MSKTDELAKLQEELTDLLEKANSKRDAIFAILSGCIATDRTGREFFIDRVRLLPGSTNVFVEGAVIKKDGARHSRNDGFSGLKVLRKIRRAGMR